MRFEGLITQQVLLMTPLLFVLFQTNQIGSKSWLVWGLISVSSQNFLLHLLPFLFHCSQRTIGCFCFSGYQHSGGVCPFLNFLWACEVRACEVLQYSFDYFTSSHVCAFLAHLPLIWMWQKSNTATHGFNQDLHDYDLMHHKLTKLHDRVLALQEPLTFLPLPPSSFERNTTGWPRNSQQKRPNLREMPRKWFFNSGLFSKKIQLDAEANIRKREHEFLSFAWERFHALVTWSFPHHFKIVSTAQAPAT